MTEAIHTPSPRPAEAAALAVAAIRRKAGALVSILNMSLLAAVFIADALTPADNVSICFAYAIPIMLSLLEGGRRSLVYAAAATLLSLAGSFIQPPGDTITAVFIANRVLAIAMQWALALVVRYRLDHEAAMARALTEQAEKVERQQRFIAILSHEVRTPLTVVDGQAYRLIKLAGDASAEDVVRRARTIREAVARLDGIVSGILASAAADRGELVANLMPVDLGRLIGDLARRVAENDGARITCMLDALPATVDADPVLLTQVFENLLANAVKYAGPGSPITITGRADGADIEIRVSDQGVGVAQGDLPHLFTPYFRGTNSRGVPGAGIGLYLVDRFMAAHGGSVAIERPAGTGTTVVLRLPQQSPHRMAAGDA
ncbi:MAG: hypothetical protein OHK0024_06810 [Thalassobaculales bacterium]